MAFGPFLCHFYRYGNYRVAEVDFALLHHVKSWSWFGTSELLNDLKCILFSFLFQGGGAQCPLPLGSYAYVNYKIEDFPNN